MLLYLSLHPICTTCAVRGNDAIHETGSIKRIATLRIGHGYRQRVQKLGKVWTGCSRDTQTNKHNTYSRKHTADKHAHIWLEARRIAPVLPSNQTDRQNALMDVAGVKCLIKHNVYNRPINQAGLIDNMIYQR